MGLDVLRNVPPEIWHIVFDLACQTDPTGSTSQSLFLVCRTIHDLAKPSRYLTLTLDGWEQVLRCDERFERLPKNHRKVVNLFVSLPALRGVLYSSNEVGWWEDLEDSDEDQWYSTDSDSDHWLSDDYSTDSDEDGDEEVHVDDVEDLSFDSSSDAGFSDDPDFDEFSDPTPEEWEAENEARAPESYPVTSAYISSTYSETSLSFLLQYHTRIASAEYQVYSALRRILVSCSSSLELLHIHYTPHHEFFLEALFPVLPHLQTLYISADQRIFRPYPPSIYRNEHLDPPPILFPQVRTVEAFHSLSSLWLDRTFKNARAAITHPEAKIVHVSKPPTREAFKSRWELRVEGKETPELQT